MTQDLDGTNDSRFDRWLSYQNEAEFRADVEKKNPSRIDIGAVYNAPVKKKDSLQDLKPEAKEFVIDIDITDYSDIRKCGCGTQKTMCISCWPFLQAAVMVLDIALREDFGFETLLWVFSGRRGMHCWVLDKKARGLNDDSRRAMASFLSCSSDKDFKKLRSREFFALHPSLNRASKISCHFLNAS